MTAAPARHLPAYRGRSLLRVGLAVLAAAGLVIDAYVHLDLAGNYAPIRTSVFSQATLFRVEAGVAIAAAALLLLRPRRYTALFAVLVAGSALAAILLYRYDDVGRIGIVPDMYEPVWFTEKTLSAVAEAVAFVTALALLLIPRGANGKDD